jgi:hypothetical protein
MSNSTRRGFIQSALGAGAAVGAGSLITAAASTAGAAGIAAPDGELLNTKGMPYRQDDPRWGKKMMWDRREVVKVAREFNDETRSDAESLLYPYKDGNNIANEGCMLSCLAMVLKMLAPAAKPSWTPATLNRAAQDAYYYTRSGLSMVTLYPDLVSEMSEGHVGLAMAQDYLPGVKGWKRVYANSAPLLRAYRALTPAQRSNYLVMIKTGTYDDTASSHYALLHPNSDQSPDEADALLLDPAEPRSHKGNWTMTDSAKWIGQEPQIKRDWAKAGIQPTQIGGAWIFSRWDPATGAPLIGPLVQSWSQQLAAG